MHNTDHQGYSVFRKKAYLENYGKWQGFLAAHKNNTFPSPFFNPAQTRQCKGDDDEKQMKAGNCCYNRQKGLAFGNYCRPTTAHRHPDDNKNSHLIGVFYQRRTRRKQPGQPVAKDDSHKKRQEDKCSYFQHDCSLINGYGLIFKACSEEVCEGWWNSYHRQCISDDGDQQGVGDIPSSAAGHYHSAAKGRRHDCHQVEPKDDLWWKGEQRIGRGDEGGDDKDQGQGEENPRHIGDPSADLPRIEGEPRKKKDNDYQSVRAVVCVQPESRRDKKAAVVDNRQKCDADKAHYEPVFL